VSAWAAAGWGAFSAGALLIGQALARPLARRRTATGLMMGFGAGTLLAAVAYELIPESSFDEPLLVGAGLGRGALTNLGLDRRVVRRGGSRGQDIAGEGGGGGTSGAAMFIGALLDGIPEAVVLGAGLALGGGVSVAFVVAVFASNVPEGVAGTLNLRGAGVPEPRIATMWTALTAVCAVAATVGFVVSDDLPDGGLAAQAFAAGAMVTMLADSMMPEAFEHGGRAVGLLTVVGYLVAAGLTLAG
jgi:ZIP family zinc transporter